MSINCDMVQDLIPLYIDGCCSAASVTAVEEHLASCADCRMVAERMRRPMKSCAPRLASAPARLERVNVWRASVLQAVALCVAFAVMAVGVSLEASTPVGLLNGFWALTLVVPATGFLLSQGNWFFIRLYPSRRRFSVGSCWLTVGLTLVAAAWTLWHYEFGFWWLFEGGVAALIERLGAWMRLYAGGILLTVGCCVLSKCLSDAYARLLGKE